MRQGADRVKESNAQKLLQEFENIQFKNGELIDEFGLRINSLAEKLRGLGEVVGEARVVRRFFESSRSSTTKSMYQSRRCWTSTH
jgi:hypothetical protein